MNETIGAKGGKNDRKRRLLITQEMKKKLEEYHQEQNEKSLIELEKKVKQQQAITFLKTLPIVAIGQIYTTLTEDTSKKKELALQEAIERIENENLFNERETKEIITALRNGTLFSLDQELLGKLGISIEGYKRVSEIDLTDFAEPKQQEEILTEEQVSLETREAILNVVELTIQEKNEQLFPKSETKENIEVTQNDNYKKTGISSDTTTEKLDKLKNHKIIEEYEKKLKEVRTDLRQLIFEYNVISEASENLYESKEAEELLERLNTIIKKIEELKKIIDIPDIDKYDDNYLYTLIEEYIEEFKNKKFVNEIKDSSLYIMISEKLDELDTKKDVLQDKIENKKTKLEIDEARIEQLKEEYFNYEKFNKDLLNFQASQDKILEDIQEKMANATSIQERVEVQVVGMQRQSRRLLAMLGASMMVPGARSARTLATMAATYLYFMRNIMRPRTVTRRYKTINVTDYHKEIENSLSQLEDIGTLLKKTSRQIDLTIKEFETKFKEYIDVIPECKMLLADLEKVKDEIKEKEYELNRIKLEQEKNLELNDSKVKTMTLESPM